MFLNIYHLRILSCEFLLTHGQARTVESCSCAITNRVHLTICPVLTKAVTGNVSKVGERQQYAYEGPYREEIYSKSAQGTSKNGIPFVVITVA